MSVHNGYSLSNGRLLKLRTQIIIGARNYNKYLVNKIFKIVCDDGTEVNIRFPVSDFKHLTGLCSNLMDDDFYQKCVSGMIGIGNINLLQNSRTPPAFLWRRAGQLC